MYFLIFLLSLFYCTILIFLFFFCFFLNINYSWSFNLLGKSDSDLRLGGITSVSHLRLILLNFSCRLLLDTVSLIRFYHFDFLVQYSIQRKMLFID